MHSTRRGLGCRRDEESLRRKTAGGWGARKPPADAFGVALRAGALRAGRLRRGRAWGGPLGLKVWHSGISPCLFTSLIRTSIG